MQNAECSMWRAGRGCGSCDRFGVGAEDGHRQVGLVASELAGLSITRMPTDIHVRTLNFAARVIRLVDALPRQVSGRVIADQIMRSAASVGAHCREARRARTKAEFASKLNVALQEADETAYWLDLIASASLVDKRRLTALRREAEEIQAMLCAAINTIKR
jgi:four helix bundle protein